jgi:hypothetical protein
MKLLDIKLTNDSSLLLRAIRNPFYWRILQKTILYSGFKNLHKEICEIRKLESIHEKQCVKRKNECRKLDKGSSLWPETSTKYAVQEFHLRMVYPGPVGGSSLRPALSHLLNREPGK